MKTHSKNHAAHFAMLLMALAMSLAFLACEEKKKPGAEQAMTEEEKQAKALKEEEAAWLKEKAVADAARAARAEAKAGAEAEKAAEEAMLKAKANCPEKKIGSPITVEAVFLNVMCGDICVAVFRLSDGNSLWLNLGGGEVSSDGEGLPLWANGVEIKEGDKVSATYQKTQVYDEDIEPFCHQYDILQSVKILPK